MLHKQLMSLIHCQVTYILLFYTLSFQHNKESSSMTDAALSCHILWHTYDGNTIQ